ncbi:hypothetical protein Tco_1183390 [Tanacetum coccineum]
MVLLRMRGYGEGGDEDVVTVGVGGRLWWPDIWPDVDAGKNGKGERRWESISVLSVPEDDLDHLKLTQGDDGAVESLDP